MSMDIQHCRKYDEPFAKLGKPEIAIDWFQMFLKKTIAALIEKLQNRELSCPSDFWNMQMSPDAEKNFWDQVIQRMDHDIQFTPNYIPSQHQENSTLHLFLCFDEACQLLSDKGDNVLSPFRIINRSIKDIGWVKHGFLCVMLDTMGQLTNFSPPTKQDPSHRISNENIKLLPPFINVMTFDALDYKLKDHPNHCLLFGRPLWGSNLTKPIEYIFNDEENRFAVSLAILSCLVSLDISTQSQLTHLLVGSYMGTCIGVSKSRENILTMYPSEPILSEVALQIIEIETNRRFVLDRLETSLKNGLVEAGHHGELVARLILIFGWQHMLQGTSFYTEERTVEEFLNTIFGDIKIHIKENNKFKQSSLQM
ncbi:9310_t:CDS:2, partial [Entrophospora sp. SA101]